MNTAVTRAVSALLLALTPVAVSADDLARECAMARDAGDAEAVQRIVDELLTGSAIVAEINIPFGENRIEATRKGQYAYTPESRRFEEIDPAEIRRREEEKQAQVEEERRRERQAAAEVERVAAAEREAAAVAERFQQEMARIKAEREAAVYSRLQEACTTLHERRPDETITNKLCLDIFLARGLPQ